MFPGIQDAVAAGIRGIRDASALRAAKAVFAINWGFTLLAGSGFHLPVAALRRTLRSIAQTSGAAELPRRAPAGRGIAFLIIVSIDVPVSADVGDVEASRALRIAILPRHATG